MSNDKDILKGRKINHPNFNKNSVDKKGKEKKKSIQTLEQSGHYKISSIRFLGLDTFHFLLCKIMKLLKYFRIPLMATY